MDEPLPWPGARAESDLLGVAGRPRLDARALPALRRRAGAAAPAPGARRRELPAARGARDRRLQRGRRDRGQARERSRARLPARAPAHRRRLGCLERRHRRDRAELRRPRRRARARAPRRQGQRPEPRRADARATSTSWRSRTPTASGSPTRCAHLVAPLADRARRLRLRPAAAALARGHEPGGRLLALRDLAAGARVARPLRDGRQRLDLRRAARALRGGRPALRARPLVPVPDGQARLPRRLRAARRRAREDDDRPLGRVPAQGAHVRPLLAARPARAHVRPARAGSALLGRDDLAPPPALRQRHPAPRAARDLARPRVQRRAASTRSCSRCTSCSGSACSRRSRCGAGCACFALADYYLLVTLATLLALGDVVRGVPAVWERAEGTR